MKQHISPKQVFSLSKKAYKKYLDFFRKMDTFVGNLVFFEPLKNGKEMLPCMSIGQMVEFVSSTQQIVFSEIQFGGGDWRVKIVSIENHYVDVYKPELCDALWEACKEVLEK